MSQIRKPIKIEVIDEDDVASGAKSKKKPLNSKAKQSKTTDTPLKRGAVVGKSASRDSDNFNDVRSIAMKKKLVTEAIDDEKDTPNSFADKLRKELEENEGVGPMSKRKVSVVEEDEDDVEELEEMDEKPRTVKVGAFRKQSFAQSLPSSDDEELREVIIEKDRSNRSVNIYRRIAYFFIFLVIGLAITSAYFLLGKVTITLVPNQEKMSSNLIFDVEDSETESSATGNTVKGVVKTVAIEQEKKYPATGAEVIGKEAIGKVTIINNYNKNQMLVATTRLLAASGEMFRLKNTVNAPAGGQIEAEIYADEPSPEMAIPATKFTIPGLWAGLQDKIYAESKEAVVYQQKTKKHIVQEDIDNATRDMRQQLLASAKAEMKKSYEEYDEVIYNLNEDTIKSTIDAEVDDEVDEATIKMSADVIVIAFNSTAASELAEQKFASSLSGNKEMISFDKESIIYSLNNYNSSQGKATINATFEGKVSLKDGETIINKEKIVGLNKQQLESFLSDLPDISGTDIKFYPSFLPEFLKKVPRLPERIEVIVKE